MEPRAWWHPVDVAVAPGGAIHVTGQIWAPPIGPNDQLHHAMVVAKYGPAGRMLWRRTWRVPKADWAASGQSVAPDPRGGVYVGGESGCWEDYMPTLWRYSAAGRLLWRRTLPVSLYRGTVSSVAADARGVVAAVQSSGPPLRLGPS